MNNTSDQGKEIQHPCSVCQIRYGSKLYQAELALRDALLRKPLGLDIQIDDLEEERNQRHFGLLDPGQCKLVGCLVIKDLMPHTVQLRQMAISSKVQGRGLGKFLVLTVEQILADLGTRKVILHARKHVQGFYARLGYHLEGKPYLEVGIPHVNMEKNIQPEATVNR